jgi:hypothetical protein
MKTFKDNEQLITDEICKFYSDLLVDLQTFGKCKYETKYGVLRIIINSRYKIEYQIRNKDNSYDVIPEYKGINILTSYIQDKIKNGSVTAPDCKNSDFS